MANDLNQCSFIGRLGKDPEARFLPTGDVVSNFSLAVGWKGKDKEGVEWVNVVAFGKLAEIINKFCLKGGQIFISGKLRTRSWDDKDGGKRYSTEVVADQMQLLGSRSDAQQSAPRPQSAQRQPAAGGGGYTEPPFNPDDDIPFALPNCYRNFKL